MKTNSFFIVPVALLSLISVNICANQEISKYFDPVFLKDAQRVQHTLLKEEQFQKIAFTTSDNIQIAGLLREQSTATCNLIFCGGFYPGNKEKMAALIPLLPKQYNLLFFDARGHGESEGTFLSTLHTYGKHEYKDITAAINFMHELNNKDIIILSVCAGSFHAVRALEHLYTAHSFQQKNIKGLVFDSGIASLKHALHIPFILQQKGLTNLFKKYVYTTHDETTIQQTYAFLVINSICSGITSACISFMQWRAGDTSAYDSIFQAIRTVDIPVLYIHAQNDPQANLNDMLKLAHATEKSSSWILENTGHANNSIAHKAAYQERLVSFIEGVLTP